jgi:hypothetical protein
MAKKKGVINTSAGSLGAEELANKVGDESRNSGFILEGQGTGRKEESSVRGDEFIGIEGNLEASTPRVQNGRPAPCTLVKGRRPHPPATHEVTFYNHPKYGNETATVCDQHLDQVMGEPQYIDDVTKFGATPEANNELRKRIYLRGIGKRNAAAQAQLSATGTAPLLQTSGRRKRGTDLDAELLKDYGTAGLVIDHVTPAIEKAEEQGGRTTPHIPEFIPDYSEELSADYD